MKNLILFKSCILVFLLCLSAGLNAQVAKGTIRFGPDLNFISEKTEIDGFNGELKTSQLNIGASLGYYIIDNLEIGLGLNLHNSKTDLGFGEQTASGIFVGPQIEYKIGLSPQFYLPIRGGIGYNSLTNENSGGDETTFSGISYGVFAGIEFIVSNKLGAVLIIGPEFGSLKDDDSDLEFDITAISSAIGVNFYF